MISTSLPRSSKSGRIAQALLHRIRRGGLQPGHRLPSESEMAAHHDTTRVTVRRAIRELVRQGVIESRPGVGHMVRSHQTALRIAILVNDAAWHAPFHRSLLHALEVTLHQHGYRYSLHPLRKGSFPVAEDATPLMNDLRTGEVAGVITLAWSAMSSPASAALNAVMQEHGVPQLSLRSVSNLAPDEHTICEAGTAHLLARGRRRIAIVLANAEGYTGCIMSEAGRRAAYRKFGLEADSTLYLKIDKYGERAGYELFHDWWPSRPDCDALIVPDDITGKGIAMAAKALQVDLNNELQLAMMWVRNSELFVPAPFTRLEMDPAATAQRAVTAVDSLVKRESPPPFTPLQPEVVDPNEDKVTDT